MTNSSPPLVLFSEFIPQLIKTILKKENPSNYPPLLLVIKENPELPKEFIVCDVFIIH